MCPNVGIGSLVRSWNSVVLGSKLVPYVVGAASPRNLFGSAHLTRPPLAYSQREITALEWQYHTDRRSDCSISWRYFYGIEINGHI